MMWKNSILLLLLLFSFSAWTQTDSVQIASISIEGNKHTKRKIILREMDFGIGDKIALTDLPQQLSRNELYILNTGLFVTTTINIKRWTEEQQNVHLLIELQESWYIFPFPIFELADRNFNVWWEEQQRSLKRVNYGIRFLHANTTGHKDPLKLVLQRGYTQKYELAYTFPGLNRSQTFGLIGEIFYARNREIAYKTVDHKLLFERRENEYPLQRFRTGFNFFYRPRLRSYHYGKIEYQKNTITDYVISELNPNYFLNGNTSQQLIFLRYEYAFENRDIKPFPLNGNYFSIVLEKEGLGIFKDRNGLYLTPTFGQYFSFNKKWSTELIVKSKIALIRDDQPYNNYYALGYWEDFLHGYELYVIDGLDYVYFKTSLRYELLNRTMNFGKIVPIKAFKAMPMKVYLSLNNDTGYVNSTQFSSENPLGNTWLWGGGLGLNFVIYYNKVIQVEYSMNHLFEKGLYLHYKLTF